VLDCEQTCQRKASQLAKLCPIDVLLLLTVTAMVMRLLRTDTQGSKHVFVSMQSLTSIYNNYYHFVCFGGPLGGEVGRREIFILD
jgi:hypothetical protein